MKNRILGTLGAVAIAGALFLSTHGSALAHHNTLTATTDCGSYSITADYFGGEGDRYAEVYVNGLFVDSVNFPGGSGDHAAFYVLNGTLPADVTVEVDLFRAKIGDDELVDTDEVSVKEENSCTPTPTASVTSTATATSTATPTATGSATATNTVTATPTLDPCDDVLLCQTPTVTAEPTQTPIVIYIDTTSAVKLPDTGTGNDNDNEVLAWWIGGLGVLGAIAVAGGIYANRRSA